MPGVQSAFILAAGEGTRLRPLTATVPKPLLPVFHKPLITFALDHFISLGIESIALNARYLHEAFYRAFNVTSEAADVGIGHYEEHPLSLFHEQVHLDTGGGLRNARSFLEQGTFLIHNGDILSDAPLQELIDHHHHSKAIVTLLLRQEGATKNVSYNQETGLIKGFSGPWQNLSKPFQEQSISLAYAGIAVVEPSFLDWISDEVPASLIPALIKAIDAKQPVAGFIPTQDYFWSDLGTPTSYLQTHLRIAEKKWHPSFPLRSNKLPWPEAIHPLAMIDSSAILEGNVVVGPDARISAHAHLKNCIVLPGATVPPDTHLSDAIFSNTSFILGK